jgi:hypothetical protein
MESVSMAFNIGNAVGFTWATMSILAAINDMANRLDKDANTGGMN